MIGYDEWKLQAPPTDKEIKEEEEHQEELEEVKELLTEIKKEENG